MERTLSHSLASCSGLVRPARGLQRLAAAPAAVRRPRAAAPRAVAGLSRESLMQQPNLNAPSEEELGSPVVAVSKPARRHLPPPARALARRHCTQSARSRWPRTTNSAALALHYMPGSWGLARRRAPAVRCVLPLPAVHRSAR